MRPLPYPFFFPAEALLFHRYAGGLEKAGPQLCYHCLAEVGCRCRSHLPVIILASRDRVMAPWERSVPPE